MPCLSLIVLAQTGCDTHSTAADDETPQRPQLPTDGLVAAYTFDGNANDVSGNNHEATVSGATLATDRFDVANRAYAFDGVDDYIDTFASHDYLNRSISLWFKANDVSGQNLEHHKIFVQNAHTLTHGGWSSFLDGGALYMNDRDVEETVSFKAVTTRSTALL